MPPVATVVIQAGDDTSVLVPVAGAVGYTARAVAREWAGGPALQTWSTSNGTAVIDSDGCHLLVDGAENWAWSRGELDVQLTASDGSTEVAGPYLVRVRPLISHG